MRELNYTKSQKGNSELWSDEYHSEDDAAENGQLFYSKSFIDTLTSEGMFLSCSIPYFYSEKGKIIIYGPNIDRYKKVRILERGFYIDDISLGKGIKVYWSQILSVKSYSNTLDLQLNDNEKILINLPDDSDITDDIYKIILDKKLTAKKYNRICPECYNLIDQNTKKCNMCGFDFERIDYNIAISDFNPNLCIYDYPAYKDFFNIGDFIYNLTGNGVILSCFMPNYYNDGECNVKIKDNEIVKTFKTVKIQEDGIYIKNVAEFTMRLLWDNIVNIKIYQNNLKITVDERNIILINLPENITVDEDIIDLILNKTEILDLREYELPPINSLNDLKKDTLNAYDIIFKKITNIMPKNDLADKTGISKNPEYNIIGEESSSDIPRPLMKYKKQIESLKTDFDSKEKHIRELIEKLFKPSQLNYTKFISFIDKYEEFFYNKVDVIMTITELENANTDYIKLQIEENINILKTLISKLDELSDELILAIEKSDDEDFNNYKEDMKNLINSVKDYK